MREHLRRDVPRDTHDRLVAGQRLGKFGDSVMPQIVKAQPRKRASDATNISLALLVVARGLTQTVECYEIGDEKRVAVLLAARAIANECQMDNPRFDTEHFLAVVRGERDLCSRPARNRKAGER